MREEKKRHGCLTTWLILVIISCFFMIMGYLMYILGRGMIKKLFQSPIYQDPIFKDQMQQVNNILNMPSWFFMILIGLAVFNIICAIVLFTWRKWGFWGFIVSSILMLVLNILFLSNGMLNIILMIAGPILSILILYGVLHIGRENKGWPQLR